MVLHTNFQTYSTKIEVPTGQNVVWPTIMAQTLHIDTRHSRLPQDSEQNRYFLIHFFLDEKWPYIPSFIHIAPKLRSLQAKM